MRKSSNHSFADFLKKLFHLRDSSAHDDTKHKLVIAQQLLEAWRAEQAKGNPLAIKEIKRLEGHILALQRQSEISTRY